MVSPAAALKFTYEEYRLLPEDGRRHELVDGEHLMTPAPTNRHQTTLLRLALALGGFCAQSASGKVWVARFDVILSEHDVVQPDLVFLARERLHLQREEGLPAPPDLAIEIVSPTSRRHDELVKRRLYARFGVREYWLVDHEVETVRVLVLSEAGYRRADERLFERGETLSSALLPGFALSIDGLFA